MGTWTAILLTPTAGAAVTTGWMARRALPAGAESFGVLFLGFLTLDVFGADNAGWLGDLSTEGFTVLGSVLLVAGLGTAYAAARAAVPALVGAQLVVAGAALRAAGGYALADFRTVVLVVAVVGTGALAVAARTLRLTVATWCAGAVTVAWWLAPFIDGTTRIGSTRTLAGVWETPTPGRCWWQPHRPPHRPRCPALPRPPAPRVGDRRHDRGLRRRGDPAAIDEPETTLALVGLAVVVVGCAVALLPGAPGAGSGVVPTGLAALLLVVLALRGATALSTSRQGLWELGARRAVARPRAPRRCVGRAAPGLRARRITSPCWSSCGRRRGSAASWPTWSAR